MRIVSVCPSLTELVFDLGRGDDLVGRTRFCVHPSPAVERVERVGGTKNPKNARIVELAPDIVLMNREENRREDAEALSAAGLRCHVSFPKDAFATAEMVREIGLALNRPGEASAIASDIELRARGALGRSVGAPPLRFVYLIWRRPWMVAAGDTFVSSLLALAGGENAFAAHPQRYPVVEPEELAEADPDLVLLSSEPFPFREAHLGELADATGLPRSRFRRVDGQLLTWHGSRTPRGIEYAESVIQGARGRGP